jgi:hypothetical protein
VDVYGDCSNRSDGCNLQNLTAVDKWRFNTWQKLGGQWYSTPSAGLCAPGRRVGDGGCTWRVKKLRKQVGKDCADRGIFSLVESRGGACFGRCPRPRNASSACWTRCFFLTMVGPRAGDGLGPEFIRGGVDVSALEQGWLRPFASSDPAKGGCPALPPPT